MVNFARAWAVLRSRAVGVPALVAVITLYGGLLRLDAFVSKYGALDRPAWARILTHDVAPLVPAVRPSGVGWPRVARPFEGGDPINYLKYAREMTSFYQPHVREPVFLALTRAALWALDNQDVAVGAASAIGGTLAIVATYLLGTALLSPLAGLLAALLTAIDFEMVRWAPDGWRDDTFMATVLFAVWALFRLRARPSFGNALLAGALCGISCLTRITALTFVVPALLWIVVERVPVPRPARTRAVGTAALIMTIVVAPYLISCAIATGDPFLSINYHTTYYRYSEYGSADRPMSVAEYLRSKAEAHPVATIDTGLNGLFVQPFITKWIGLAPWSPGLSRIARALAVAGLAGMVFLPGGRLLLVALLGSLVPYMFTWNIGDGNAWRFTMHAYPFFLIASAVAVVGAARALRAVAAEPSLVRSMARPMAWRALAIGAAAVGGIAAYYLLPWYVVREAIALGESTSVETGVRDRVFYREGWSAPHFGSIVVRVSRGDRSVVRVPLPERRAYDIVLRVDPVTATSPAVVDVLFNRKLIGHLHLSYDPQRVGSYRLRAGEDIVHAGSNEIAVVPSATVPAGAAGPRFEWLNPADAIGVRLWYVRVLP